MDKKRVLLSAAIGVFIIVSVILIVKIRSHAVIKVNPAFKEYVSAFTSGIVSTEATIKVRLANDFADSSMFEKPVTEELFDFSPSIAGKAYWIDTRTIEFRPDQKLPVKQLFTARFYLSKLINVPDSLKTLVFQFQTAQQAFEVTVKNHKAYDKKNLAWEKITGTLVTADAADPADVAKLLAASQDGRVLKISVTAQSDRKNFDFVIDSVKRGEDASSVNITWNGKPVDADTKGTLKVEIPSINVFNFTAVKVVQSPEQYVLLQFSDPLLEDQDLNGLIRLGTIADLKFTIEDNEVRVYAPSEQTGMHELIIEPAVANAAGKQLGKQVKDSVTFEDIKPDIRLVGNGVILPSTNGLIFPFEAVNLKAVDVKIFKIYENNVAQYLQVNDLNGDRELSRVGKIVLKKTVQLQTATNAVVNYAKWNRFSLDLADLIKAEPGAIYRVTLSIKKDYAFYSCDGSDDTEANNDENMNPSWNDAEESEEPTDWFYYNDYYYDYDYDYYYYDWYERDNPCDDSYYRSKTVSRNVLATDIGLIAKVGTGGELNVYSVNLVNATPMSGVTIEVLDYQNQLLYKGSTDNAGQVIFQLKKVPYLLVAKKGDQRSYMKLTGGSALSLSMFDVSGEAVRKGLKGFLYGERGVWRPGDSIYLTFILEDKLDKLPPDVPVIFEMSNPAGQKVVHMVKSASVNGFYDFRTATDPSAPTGNWTAEVKVGGSSFTKTVRVETIKPNRLKIKLDFGADKITAASLQKGMLEAKWLHGAIARNLKADVTMTLNRSSTAFEKFKGYEFDDPSRRFYSETYTVFSGNLDANGVASVDPNISLNASAPGVLRASFETRVFEQGGEFSIDRMSVPYYPYSTYVGIKEPEGQKYTGILLTGKDHLFSIVNVDVNGKLQQSKKLKVDIFKVRWRWWWDNSGDDLADYMRGTYNEPYLSKEIITTGGKAVLNMNIPDADWGRYFIRVTDPESNHSTGAICYFDWDNWASRNSDDREAAAMLVFSSDKDKYKVGEEVKLTIPSTAGARALITIESGTKVLQSFWTETEAGQTIFTFKVTDEMAPNVYASVTLIQPHGQTANDLPLRLYGVIPIFIDDPNTHLRPVISMADVLRPEENASITVKEETGKAMTYTVAVVDEGLLDLTNYKTPDPWNYFYSREALGVKSWDLYDQVMGAYGGQLERILSLGGGDEGKEGAGKNRANRFKPMVKYFGPFALPKGSSHTYNFKMPQYIGSVRVMVIAGQDKAYGSAEKTVAVRKPLMLLATLPRVVGPGETVTLPVSVFAMEKKIKNVSVKVTTNDMFTNLDNSMKSITFSEIGDELVNFSLKVKDNTGIGKVKVMANCGGEYAYYEIEIDVRNPNPEVTDFVETMIKPGDTWNPDYTPLGIKGTNKGTIEISSIPPIGLEKRLKYLLTYPYGCIEQTTSSAFPQLYLSDVLELDAKFKGRIESNIKAAISRIASFQASSGGFSYWPGSGSADPWGSTYAGHFLLEAKEKGYNVSPTVLKNWAKYQKKMALAWSSTLRDYYYFSDLDQAYRLYTLALAKQPELGAMNLLREQKNLSVQAKWRLAAAYQLAGQAEMARKLANSATMVIQPYREMYYTYGSDDRDRAMIIEALSLMDMRMKAAPLVKLLSERMSRNEWMSTQTTAYCLIAICKFVNGNGATGGMDFTCSVNAGAATQKKSTKSVATIDMNLKGSDAKGKVKIKNNGKSILYARIVLSGVPAAGQEKASESNLKIEVMYTDLQGKKIDPSKLQQGTDLIAEVTITNPGLMGYYNNMVLNEIFPSGWEIHNSRMDNSYGRITMSPYSYQDFRDDRVYTFFDIAANTKRTYKVLLNASYLGKFYLPAVSSEAMYNNSINARTTGKWVEVVPYADNTTAKK